MGPRRAGRRQRHRLGSRAGRGPERPTPTVRRASARGQRCALGVSAETGQVRQGGGGRPNGRRTGEPPRARRYRRPATETAAGTRPARNLTERGQGRAAGPGPSRARREAPNEGPQTPEGSERPEADKGPKRPRATRGPGGPKGRRGPGRPRGAQTPEGNKGAGGRQGAQTPEGNTGPRRPTGRGGPERASPPKRVRHDGGSEGSEV